MQGLGRTFVNIYTAALAVAALIDWYFAIELRHSQLEHLLPGVVFAALSLPSSLTSVLVFEWWPNVFSNEMAGVAWLTVCSAFQVAVLRHITRARVRAIA